jgi:hypothetical protein
MSLAASTAALRVAADARAVLAAASRALVRAEKRAAKYAAIELPLDAAWRAANAAYKAELALPT